MMMKDFRYIIKKIIIGIGIILGISLIRSCKVYALESSQYSTLFYNEKSFPLNQSSVCHSVGQTYKYVINSHEYNIQYKNDGIYVNDMLVSNDGDYLCNAWILLKWVDNGDNVVFNYFKQVTGYNKILTLYTPSILTYSDNFPYTANSLYAGGQGIRVYRYRYNFSNGNYSSKSESEITNCTSGCYDHNDRTNLYYNTVIYDYNFYVYGVNNATHLSLFYNNSSRKYITSDYSSPNYVLKNPVINSLNPVLNKTDEGMLTSVSFTINFSYIDNENYNYYAWFKGYDKMKITSNNVVLNTQQNTTLYVEITDKQGNNIDSETFNVSSIGMIYDGSYDIQFYTTELTSSDTTNDSDLVIDEINRIDIDITYIPKWINYKYQYQWVNQNESLTDNWVTINPNSAKNNYTYVTRVNGILYARILDSDDNVLKSSTYSITRIGQLKTYDKNSNRLFNMFNNLNSSINFGGPISNLIVMPVNFLETILKAGAGQCSPYYLGTIGGHPLTLTCVNPQDYLGSSLWSLIDIIISGCLIYSIAKWLTSLYWNFVMLQNTPDINPEHFGDRRDLL